MIEAVDGHDVLTVLFETPLEGEALARCEEELALIFKAKLGCTPGGEGRAHGRAAAFRKEDQAHLRQPLLSAPHSKGGESHHYELE